MQQLKDTDRRKKHQQEESLYNQLPASLGGTKSRPCAADINALLPHQKGPKVPSTETVNNAIRHKVISLAPQPQAKKATTQDPTKPTNNKRKDQPSCIRRNPKRKKITNQISNNKITLSKDERQYCIYQPLLELWIDYASKLRRDDINGFPGRVTRMDLHGAPVSIIRCRDPGLVGIEGILVAETANTIIIVTKKNTAVTVPKNVTVISIKVDGIEIEIYLPALAFRASERSARKIKKKHMPYI